MFRCQNPDNLHLSTLQCWKSFQRISSGVPRKKFALVLLTSCLLLPLASEELLARTGDRVEEAAPLPSSLSEVESRGWASRIDASTRGFNLTLADSRLKIACGRPKGKTSRWTAAGWGGRGKGGRGADNQRNRREDLERPRGWVGAFSRPPSPRAVPAHSNPPPDLYHQSRYNFELQEQGYR